MNALTSDTFFNGRLSVKQPESGYRFSIDAVLLANFVYPAAGDRIVDLGTGCGIIPMILAYRYKDVRVYGLEIQEQLAGAARINIQDNGMMDQISILCDDLRKVNADLFSGSVDLVVSNPPFRKNASGRINPQAQRAVARHEIKVTLEDVISAAKRILKVSGRLVTLYPADRLADVVSALRNLGVEPKRLRLIHSREGEPGRLFLMEAVKGGRPAMEIAPPLFIYGPDGGYTPEVTEMFKG